MTRRSLHLPLALAALALLVLGVLVASGAGAAEVPRTDVVDREAFAAGAAAAVEFQAAPLPSPPTDDLTRASCRWRFDGTNPPAARDRRTAFLAGCDDMTVRTDLERRSR